MRRATAMLLGTVAGTALLVGGKYGMGATNGAANAGNAIGPQDDTASTDPNASATAASPTANPATEPTAPAPAGSAAAPAGGAKPTPTAKRSTQPAAPRTTPAGNSNCTSASGAATNVVSPGVGAVTVTIKVCNGAVTTASAVISQSNWSSNTAAIKSLNTLAVQYYKTDISKLNYSGATLTSNAYQGSLKSALSKAGI